MHVCARAFHGLSVMLVALALVSCSRLGALNTVMPHDAGGARVAEGVRYGQGPRHRLDVYAPADGAANAPVVVFVYGGGWDSGHRGAYSFVGRALAARGFVAVVPDYRLVPKVRYPAFVKDAAAAVRWTHDTIAQYGGDPGRIGVAGHSAGAYTAVMLATDPAYTDPDSDTHVPVRAAAGLAGPYDFLPLDVRQTKRAFEGVADLKATQPVNVIRGDGPPLFLAAGAADETVEPRNTRALAERARAVGRPVTVRQYEGADHADVLLALGTWFRDTAPVLDDLTAFFRRRLGADAPS